MHRSGATIRQSHETKLHSLVQQVSARWESFNLKKSTPSTPLPRLSEVALRGLRLEQQPFSPPIGSHAYYVDTMIDNLLGVVEESLLQSNNLIVLAGERSSGKTCSVAQITHSLADTSQLFVARGSAVQTAEQIVRSMLSAFRSTTPTHVDDCLEHLSNYLAERESTGSNSVLILEDSDLIDRRELQLLLNHLDHLNESINGALKLLFTSALPAEQLLSGLHSDQLNQGHVEEFRQPLLADEQVVEYIDARLLMAGSDEELPLNERTITQIVQISAGLPGEIDLAATDALNQHYQNKQFKALLSPAHWRAATRQSGKWLAIGATLLMTGLAMAFFSGNTSADRSGTMVREIAIPATQPTEPTELQLVPPTLEPTTEPTPIRAATPAPSKPAKTVAPTPVAKVEPEPIKPTPAPKVESVATPAPKPTPVQVAPAKVATAPSKPKASTPNVSTTTNDAFVAGVVSGHQWILRRDPTRFTAQMSAGWSERDLRLFATNNGMTNKTAIYRTTRDGKGWFSLIHGDFASPTEATNAIAKLPKVWRKNKPWIRSFASIQKAIK